MLVIYQRIYFSERNTQVEFTLGSLLEGLLKRSPESGEIFDWIWLKRNHFWSCLTKSDETIGQIPGQYQVDHIRLKYESFRVFL